MHIRLLMQCNIKFLWKILSQAKATQEEITSVDLYRETEKLQKTESPTNPTW